MKVLIDISEGYYKTLQKMQDVGLGYYQKAIRKGISIPDNATNGDVIKMLFPNLMVTVLGEAKPIPYVIVMWKNYGFNNTYPLDWWNAPYKGE